MLLGAAGGELELRRAADGAVRLDGRFPYNSPAVISDGGRAGGRPRKEKVARGAFNYTIEREEIDVHFLAGHDFGKPLASKKSGTLKFRDTADALLIAASISPFIMRASYAQDAIAGVEAGLVTGLSPGFRLPPPTAVPPEEAERVEEEDPKEGDAIIRTILQAILVEFSLVTRPAYQEASVEARSAAGGSQRPAARFRWRA